ncbi:MAG TPA: MazG family protein [Opitutae bacterium]|jgi:XTP/dITP diphosphohydrolase/tetrapyrrole methylase family protein/MazG family protein|nr:MazG family protein [Opitutae bacterium]
MSSIDDLLQTVAALREPETGCPWDIEQDHQSLAECLVDECCELLQTIDRLDMDHMEEELGDVLMQVVMHAQIAKESGAFDFESVCRVVNEKLVTRHPHVFGDSAHLDDSSAVLKQWDEIKAAEKKRGPQQIGRFKDLPKQLPALMFAQDVYKQIQKKKMDASDVLDEGGIAMTSAALAADEAALGKQLFEIAAACRIKKIDPESALRRYTQNVVDQLEQGAAVPE